MTLLSVYRTWWRRRFPRAYVLWLPDTVGAALAASPIMLVLGILMPVDLHHPYRWSAVMDQCEAGSTFLVMTLFMWRIARTWGAMGPVAWRMPWWLPLAAWIEYIAIYAASMMFALGHHISVERQVTVDWVTREAVEVRALYAELEACVGAPPSIAPLAYDLQPCLLRSSLRQCISTDQRGDRGPGFGDVSTSDMEDLDRGCVDINCGNDLWNDMLAHLAFTGDRPRAGLPASGAGGCPPGTYHRRETVQWARDVAQEVSTSIALSGEHLAPPWGTDGVTLGFLPWTAPLAPNGTIVPFLSFVQPLALAFFHLGRSPSPHRRHLVSGVIGAVTLALLSLFLPPFVRDDADVIAPLFAAVFLTGGVLATRSWASGRLGPWGGRGCALVLLSPLYVSIVISETSHIPSDLETPLALVYVVLVHAYATRLLNLPSEE